MKFQLDSSKPRIFPSTSSPSTGWKFSFLVLSDTAVNATCPWIIATVVFPTRTLLLASTIAPLPITVALVRLPVSTAIKLASRTILTPEKIVRIGEKGSHTAATRYVCLSANS
jgi:hypothetical protein